MSQLYLEEFVSLMQRPWISAASHHDLWMVTIPQLAQSSNTLRQAAMAIGAMAIWNRQTQRSGRCPTRFPGIEALEDKKHYVRALSHYSESLKWQRQQPSTLDAVFLSILLLTFETLRGSRIAALNHVNHGLALLLALVVDDQQKHIDALSPNPRPLIGAVADIYGRLSMQARFILCGHIGESRPLPHFTQGLEARDLTVDAFFGLVDQIVPRTADLARIPAVFSSLDEFEVFMIAAQKSARRLNSTMLDSFAQLWASQIDAAKNNHDSLEYFWSGIFGDKTVVDICEYNEKISTELDDAFVPLFNKFATLGLDSPDYIRAIHLRLQCLGFRVFDNPFMFFNLDSLYKQTPICREYLSLADIAIRAAQRDTENPTHQLALQNDVAWRLTIIAMFCRDPVVRDDAVWKLRDYPGYNGLWNARSLYVLTSRNRHVERGNIIEGTPEEQWHRLWRREYVFEEGGDKIIFRYMEKNAVTGAWGLVEETTRIGGDADAVCWVRQDLSVSGRLLMAALVSM